MILGLSSYHTIEMMVPLMLHEPLCPNGSLFAQSPSSCFALSLRGILRKRFYKTSCLLASFQVDLDMAALPGHELRAAPRDLDHFMRL